MALMLIHAWLIAFKRLPVPAQQEHNRNLDCALHGYNIESAHHMMIKNELPYAVDYGITIDTQGPLIFIDIGSQRNKYRSTYCT